MGKASPNHNIANHALELAGQEVMCWLGAIRHGGKAYEVAPFVSGPSPAEVGTPGCVLGTERAQQQVLVLPLARGEDFLARAGPHPDSGILGTQMTSVNLDFLSHKKWIVFITFSQTEIWAEEGNCQHCCAHERPLRPPRLAGFLGPDSPPALPLCC